MATESSNRLIVLKWLNCIFFHNQWKDVNHIWQLWSFDDVYPFYVIYDQWPFCLVAVAKLFKKKKKKRNILKDNTSKTTEAVGLLFDTNVAWVRAIQRQLWSFDDFDCLPNLLCFMTSVHFVWLLWQNLRRKSVKHQREKKDPVKHQKGKEDPYEHNQGKKILDAHQQGKKSLLCLSLVWPCKETGRVA